MTELPNYSGVWWLVGKNPDVLKGLTREGVLWQGNEDRLKMVYFKTYIHYYIKAFRPLFSKNGFKYCIVWLQILELFPLGPLQDDWV